ncbi:MAG: phage tail tape measure protein [Pirellulales bacterium]
MAEATATIRIIGKDDASRELSKVERTLADLKGNADKATSAFGGLFKQFTAANLASSAIQKGLQELKTAMIEPIRLAGDFEQRLADISTLISGESNEAIGQLRDGILNLTKVIPKNADELGAASYDILSAGITDSNEALKVLEASSKLAVGGLGSTKEGVDILTSAINAFHIDAGKANDVADVFFKTVRDGKNTVADLSRAFGATAPIVASSGVSLEDFAAATAALTSTGLPASEAQNALRQAIVSMQKPTEDMKNLFDEIGVHSFSEMIGKGMTLGEIFQALQTASHGSNEVLAQAIGRVEALNAVIGIGSTVNDKYTATLKSMTEGGNALDEAFQKQAGTLKNQWQIAVNKLQSTLLEVGDKDMPKVKSVVAELSEALDNNKSAIANAAEALSATLVSAMNMVVKSAPELLAAIGGVASLVERAASAIDKYLGVARRIGEGIGVTATTLSALGHGDVESAQSVSEAYKEALLSGQRYTDVVKERLSITEQNIALQEKHGIGLGKARESLIAAAVAEERLREQKKKQADENYNYNHSTKKTTEEIEKLSAAVDDLKGNYWSARSEVDRALGQLVRDHKEKMAQIREEIADTKAQLADLETSFKRSTLGIDTSEADVINDAIKKVDDLEKKLRDLNLRRESQVNQGLGVDLSLTNDIEDVTKELERERASLAAIQAAASSDVTKLAKVRGEKSDAENRFNDLEIRRKQDKEDHAQRLQQLQEELQKNEEKARAEQKAYQDHRQELVDTKTALLDFHDTYIARLGNLQKVTEDVLTNMKKKLDDLKTTISQIDALLKAKPDITGGTTVTAEAKKRAAGGVVTESMTIVGERGPELVSLPYGSKVYTANESRSLSGGVTISAPLVGQVIVQNEADEDRLVEKLARLIQLQSLHAA